MKCDVCKKTIRKGEFFIVDMFGKPVHVKCLPKENKNAK